MINNQWTLWCSLDMVTLESSFLLLPSPEKEESQIQCVQTVCFPMVSTLMLFSWDNGLGDTRYTWKGVSMQLNTTTLYPLKSGNNIRFTQTTKRLCFWSDFPANPYLGILMSRKKNVFSSSSVPWNTDLKRCTTGENCSGQLSLGNANSKRLLDTYNEYFSILRF